MEKIKEQPIDKHRDYVALAEFLDTSLLGLLAGMISGIAINILTGDSIPLLSWLAIAMVIVSVVFIVRLIQVRTAIDEAYTSREGLGLKHRVRWRASVDPDDNKKRRTKFFSAIIGVLIFLTAGLVFNYLAKQKTEHDIKISQLKDMQQSKFDSLSYQIKKLEDSMRTMEWANKQILSQIKSNTDSIKRSRK